MTTFVAYSFRIRRRRWPLRKSYPKKTTGDLINIVAVGSDDKLVALLQAGLIAGIVVEDPFRMGYDGVKIALAASKGEEVSAKISIPARCCSPKPTWAPFRRTTFPSPEVK